MLSFDSTTLYRIKNWTLDSLYVVTDFDRTLTSHDSETSWNILSQSNIMGDEYCKERKAFFDYYRPIELDPYIDHNTKNNLMVEWWEKHIELFIKYKLSESTIDTACKNINVMAFRKGAKNFLQTMKELNIPVIIISAGIGNFIKEFLIANNCDFDNIHIISNFIKFNDGIAVGVSDNIIHSLNKNEVELPKEILAKIQHRKNIILFGDSVADILMIKEPERKSALKIGFLDENIDQNFEYFIDAFDIVATAKANIYKIWKILPFSPV